MVLHERLTTFTRKTCIFQNWNFFCMRSIRLSTVLHITNLPLSRLLWPRQWWWPYPQGHMRPPGLPLARTLSSEGCAPPPSCRHRRSPALGQSASLWSEWGGSYAEGWRSYHDTQMLDTTVYEKDNFVALSLWPIPSVIQWWPLCVQHWNLILGRWNKDSHYL